MTWLADDKFTPYVVEVYDITEAAERLVKTYNVSDLLTTIESSVLTSPSRYLDGSYQSAYRVDISCDYYGNTYRDEAYITVLSNLSG